MNRRGGCWDVMQASRKQEGKVKIFIELEARNTDREISPLCDTMNVMMNKTTLSSMKTKVMKSNRTSPT